MLNDDTIDRFRVALREHCANPSPGCAASRDVVVATANAARADGMSAEQFVIWVKGVWSGIMAEGSLERGLDAAREREVVISAAIKAYYVQ
ncbi:MAG: hypothetical protein ABI026_08055 [Gemmatimonadaceae bacterium]